MAVKIESKIKGYSVLTPEDKAKQDAAPVPTASIDRATAEAETPVDPLTLIKLIQGQPKRYKFEGATQFRFLVPMERPDERFNTLEALFERLTPQPA